MGCFARKSATLGHHRTGFNHNGTSRDVLREIQQPRDTTAVLYSGVLRKTQSMAHLPMTTMYSLYQGIYLHGGGDAALHVPIRSDAKQSSQDKYLGSRCCCCCAHINSSLPLVYLVSGTWTGQAGQAPIRLEWKNTSDKQALVIHIYPGDIIHTWY